MERQEVFDKMISGKKVRISEDYRDEIRYGCGGDKGNLGQWFFIVRYSHEDTIDIYSKTRDQVYLDVPLKELRT